VTGPAGRSCVSGFTGRTWLLRRLVLVLVAVATAGMLGPVPAAQAHAFLVGSNPGDGQVLAEAPTHLRLDFSESVVLGATRIDIVDGNGRHLAARALRLVSHGSAQQSEDPVEVVADLAALAKGSYRISWETLSSDDLHSTRGELIFGVGQAVTAVGLHEPAPSLVEAALRWLILLGLSGALGGELARRLLEGAGGPVCGRAARLARKVSARSAITGAVVALILLANQLAAPGSSVAALLWSSYGARWGLREAGLVLLVVSATAGPRNLSVMTSRLLVATGGALACLGTALLGHSGAGTTPNLTRVIASAAHLGAATTWSGCVAVLAIVLVRRRRGGMPSRDLARTVLRAFGPPAAVCVGVMVVTGIYLSSNVIGSVDAALFTIYGRTLLAKVMLAGIAGSLALVNIVRLHRRTPRPTPWRTLVAETVAGVAVLALAGVLTSAQPAMEPQLVQSTVSASTVVDGAVADLQESVSISPNRPGPSVVLVDVFDTRRPSPGPVREVIVSLVDASGRTQPQRAERIGDGRWSLATRLTAPGPVQVQVMVRRGGIADAGRTFDWTVGAGEVLTREAIISTAPVRTILEKAAISLLFLLVFAGVLTLWVRRHRLRRRQADLWGEPELPAPQDAELAPRGAGLAAQEAELALPADPADGRVDQRTGAGIHHG